jgi:hypothetical protein
MESQVSLRSGKDGLALVGAAGLAWSGKFRVGVEVT